jgi:hypothetical protein
MSLGPGGAHHIRQIFQGLISCPAKRLLMAVSSSFAAAAAYEVQWIYWHLLANTSGVIRTSKDYPLIRQKCPVREKSVQSSATSPFDVKPLTLVPT